MAVRSTRTFLCYPENVCPIQNFVRQLSFFLYDEIKRVRTGRSDHHAHRFPILGIALAFSSCTTPSCDSTTMIENLYFPIVRDCTGRCTYPVQLFPFLGIAAAFSSCTTPFFRSVQASSSILCNPFLTWGTFPSFFVHPWNFSCTTI